MRRMVGIVVLSSALCLVSSAAGRAQEPATMQATTKKSVPKSVKAKLEAAIPELMWKGGVPGLQIALIENGNTTWLGDFGVKNASTGQHVTDETIFEAASLSKAVFAYGALKLVEQGKLDLDAPLTGYLSKPYIEGDERLKLITARIVLSHRTGFPNWRGKGNALTIRFTPGERFSYSGEGFVYLQKAVEQITGKPLNEYMTEAVFVPLGMKSSGYVWRPEFDERTATGHDADGQVVEKFKPAEANAAASLHTTAADYAIFVDAIVNGKGLKRAMLKQMETPQIAVDPTCTNCTEHPAKELSKELFWGLGWGIAQTGQGEVLWHWGDNGAFRCFVAANPKRKSGVVLFTNSENGLAIAEELVQVALGSDLPMFRWIKYDRYDSPAMRFAAAVRERGATAAIAEFDKELRAGAIEERSINSLGYRLLQQKKIEEAIEVFQLNVRLHPGSSNAYDSLGEAYMNHGEKELAILNYEKSLELDAKNGNAAETLKKLREK
jgi:CubicO group peptidase (beta-lactamase class C family)